MVRIRPLAIEQLLAAIIEAAEIGIVALLVDVADAAGEAKAILAGISALRNAALDAAGEPHELALGDEVAHARDRIRTVGRRRAVAHHLNLIEERKTNMTEKSVHVSVHP